MLKKLLIFAIKAYQYALSPFLPPSCRFYPSCSAYALDTVNEYGFAKGLFYTLKRVTKCHPFHPGGYDPPISKENRKRAV
jgi:hypothetical protein